MQASERRAEALWRLALDGADDHTVDEIPLEKRVDDDDRHHADGGRIELNIGIFSDSGRAEVITAQCQNWERDLKIKTFCQQKTWSEGVRPWWLASELPTRRPSRSTPRSAWSWRSRPPSWWC